MEGPFYYVALAVVLFIAVHFFRRGHFALSFAVLAVGAWLVYSHEENITYTDIKQNIYTTIDDAAKSEYDTKMKSELYDYDKNKVESNKSTVK